MHIDVVELEQFYKSRLGLLVQRSLRNRVRELSEALRRRCLYPPSARQSARHRMPARNAPPPRTKWSGAMTRAARPGK